MFSIVIVTYNKDFESLRICLSSINRHLFNKTIPIVIVLNDSIDYVEDLTAVVNSFELNISILHYTQVAPWGTELNWWSQQYFKLTIADKINTSWYLIIDSDDIIINDFDTDQLFFNNRAKCLTEDYKFILNSTNPELKEQLQRAYDIFNITQLPTFTMGNLTPFMLNTQVVKRLIKDTTLDCFNARYPKLLTLEFYLYYAYLTQQDLFNKLYSPVNNLDYVFDKRQQIIDTSIQIL